jgi:hypothetical protein
MTSLTNLCRLVKEYLDNQHYLVHLLQQGPAIKRASSEEMAKMLAATRDECDKLRSQLASSKLLESASDTVAQNKGMQNHNLLACHVPDFIARTFIPVSNSSPELRQ